MTFFNIFSNKKIKERERAKIIVDHREKNSLVISELMKRGHILEFAQLPVADYIVRDIAIERKTISDFKSSLISKRMVNQLNELKQYPKHLFILEGLESRDLYKGNIHENAIRGFLLTIALEFKTPIIYSLNEEDTAKYISILANRKKGKEESIRASKNMLSEKEQLQFILEGFPDIGRVTIKEIMVKFENLKDLISSPKEKLEEVIGKKAEKIYNLINYKFN